MSPLTSRCMECGGEAEFDPVPDAMPSEFICRRCAAAYLVDPVPSVAARSSLAAVA